MNEAEKNILGLHLPTDPRWVDPLQCHKPGRHTYRSCLLRTKQLQAAFLRVDTALS